MANSEQTKRALAEGLKTALRSQEFDQITVADITECSEVSRNTFYYHFRDKQELVDWIFHTDLGPVLRDSRPGRTWNEALTELLARLRAPGILCRYPAQSGSGPVQQLSV